MYSNVLVPVDRGIKSNKMCLQEAEEITESSGQIHCLFVKLKEIENSSENDIESPIKNIESYIKNSNYNYVTDNGVGKPSKKIASYANKNDVDAIVMNTYNPSGIKKLITGSVTEDTIEKTSCPVLVLSTEY